MNLIISGNHCSIPCWCTRWDTSNYSITIETFMTKGNLQDFKNSIVPGAVKELYQIMGKSYYHDQTWQGNNTIRLIPQATPQGTLSIARQEKVCFPKTITTSTMKGDDGWIMCKVEAYVSGNQNL